MLSNYPVIYKNVTIMINFRWKPLIIGPFPGVMQGTKDQD
jgi:hypothetical protein